MRRVVGLWVAVLVVLAGLASVGGAAVVGRDVAEVGVASRARSAELEVSAAAVKLVGSVVAGSATVANVGGAGARSSTAAVAWRSSVGGDGLVELGRFKVPALRAGERHKASFRVGVPKGATGSYDVSVCADVLGQVQAHAKNKSKCRSAGAVTIPASGVKGYGPTGPEPSPPSGSGGSSPPPTGSGSGSSPPETVIDSGPTGLIGESSVTFTFHGSDTDDTFQCALDGAPWVSCASPQQYTALAEGAHTFQVRAVNAAGEVDPTPASASFTVEATPPQTTITSAPHGRIPTGEVSISFTSSEAGSTYQCSLDGGGYSPCSSPYVIADPASGPHTFSVQATNQAGVKEAAAPPAASWSSVEAQHDLCGTISSNTTIGPDYAARYVVTCPATIASTATLTAQPGTIVKAIGGYTELHGECLLCVEGTLDAVGSEDEPITFTSINDNSVGGATGSGTPKTGDWAGIGAVADGSLDLEHADLRYALYAVGVEEGSGSLVLRGDAFAGSFWSVYGETSGSATIADSSFSIPAGSFGGVSIVAPDPTVQDNAVNDDASDERAAFAVGSSSLDLGRLTGNTMTGSAVGSFAIGGALGVSGTLPKESYPWEIGPAPSASNLNVPSGVTMSVEPGTIVKAIGGYTELHGECSLCVEGTLDAVGSEDEPITFTSINDNSVGGDTAYEEVKPGSWAGIVAHPSATEDPTITLKNAIVTYGASGLSVTTNKTAEVEHDLFAHNKTAVEVHATLGTNAAIHANWFDENEYALKGSSDWDPVSTLFTSCRYVPMISATKNEYGPTKSSFPFLTEEELSILNVALLVPETGSWPDEWYKQVNEGPTDGLGWTELPCSPAEEPDDAHFVVATPFETF